jgi:hypothetical protein
MLSPFIKKFDMEYEVDIAIKIKNTYETLLINLYVTRITSYIYIYIN